MASAKIATLAIRTIAKPIATQLKVQAAEHQRFRAFCIGLAQLMHRVEMRMRSNLLGANTEHQKIRPLSESKAIANGANAISEGFLFAVAAALIIGESYRSSRSSAKQRNRTEEAVEEVRESVEELVKALGWSMEELEERKRLRREREAATAAAAEGPASDAADADLEKNAGTAGPAGLPVDTPLPTPAHPSLLSASPTAEADAERERLQRAVQVLLQLALRSGWVQGQDALDLDAILAGRDGEKATAGGKPGTAASVGAGSANSGRSSGNGASVQERIAALGRSSPVVFVPASPSAAPEAASAASADTQSAPPAPPESLS